MKFEVKVGKPIEGPFTVTVENAEANEKPFTVIINPVDEPKKDFSLKKAVVYVVISLIMSVSVVSITYGMATGDYSVAKSIGESGKDAIGVLVKLGMKQQE